MYSISKLFATTAVALSIATSIVSAEPVKRSAREDLKTSIEKYVKLSAEQEAQFKASDEEKRAAIKKIREAAGITKEQVKLRSEAVKATSDDVKKDEMTKQANEKANYTEAQAEARKKEVAVFRDWRFKTLKMLTPEQMAKLPEYHQAELKRFTDEAAKEKGE